MNRAREALGDLVNFEAVEAIRPLDPPVPDKGDIPRLIHCPLYLRAQSRVESAMERHTQKVQQAEARVRQSQEQIADLEGAIAHWGKQAKGVGLVNQLTLDRTSAASVERYNRDVTRHNDAVEQVRRFQDRLDDAATRHQDLVQQAKDAAAEAQERLDELTAQALAHIDQDLVAFLDRCAQVVGKLAEGQAPEDQAAALEAAFLGLKAFHACQDHIEDPAARQQARQNLAELEGQFGRLCAAAPVQAALGQLLDRHRALVESNAALCSRLAGVVGAVDQGELDSLVGSLQVRFRETFTTQFQYQGVVDPCRLQDITTRMHQSLAALGHNMDQVKALAQGAAGAAQGAASAQGSGQGLLTEMEDRVAGMEGRLLGPRHFLRDLLAPEAAEGLFRQELRAAAGQLRRRLDKSLGADQVTAVLSQEDDPFSLARGQGLLEQADLLRLATCLGQVQPHTVRLTRTVQAIGQDIERAHRVPAENAGTFRSATARLYLLSCLPLLGLFPALALRRRVEAYQSAFRSTLPVYRALGAETLARNHTYRAVTLVANFPAALVLAQVGRRLESYLGPASGQPAADGLVRVE